MIGTLPVVPGLPEAAFAALDPNRPLPLPLLQLYKYICDNLPFEPVVIEASLWILLANDVADFSATDGCRLLYSMAKGVCFPGLFATWPRFCSVELAAIKSLGARLQKALVAIVRSGRRGVLSKPPSIVAELLVSVCSCVQEVLLVSLHAGACKCSEHCVIPDVLYMTFRMAAPLKASKASVHTTDAPLFVSEKRLHALHPQYVWAWRVHMSLSSHILCADSHAADLEETLFALLATRVPGSPEHVRGVCRRMAQVDLRGMVTHPVRKLLSDRMHVLPLSCLRRIASIALAPLQASSNVWLSSQQCLARCLPVMQPITFRSWQPGWNVHFEELYNKAVDEYNTQMEEEYGRRPVVVPHPVRVPIEEWGEYVPTWLRRVDSFIKDVDTVLPHALWSEEAVLLYHPMAYRMIQVPLPPSVALRCTV